MASVACLRSVAALTERYTDTAWSILPSRPSAFAQARRVCCSARDASEAAEASIRYERSSPTLDLAIHRDRARVVTGGFEMGRHRRRRGGRRRRARRDAGPRDDQCDKHEPGQRPAPVRRRMRRGGRVDGRRRWRRRPRQRWLPGLTGRPGRRCGRRLFDGLAGAGVRIHGRITYVRASAVRGMGLSMASGSSRLLAA